MDKLTYSGAKVNNYVYFAFKGESFEPSRITEWLGIKPTETSLKGHPVPKKASWRYRVNAGSSPDVESAINKVVARFLPLIEEINELKALYSLDTQLTLVIDIDVILRRRRLTFHLIRKPFVSYMRLDHP